MSDRYIRHCLLITTKAMAIMGGILFILLIGMSLVSIIGRKLGYGSVNGDIELMQAGAAVAVTAFLPYCTLLGEHLKVDFFTSHLQERTKRLIDSGCELLLGLVALLLTWYTADSALETYHSGEETPLVALPLWIPNAALVPGLGLMALAALYRGIAGILTEHELPGVQQ